MTNIAIRPYEPTDAEICARIFDRAWHSGHPYAPRRIDLGEFRAHTRNETILVAEAPEQGVVGFVSVYEPASFVHNLYVEPEVQGGGIGKALLASALALTGGKASLKCQSRNPQALGFYRHLGWTPGEEGETELGPWVRMHSP
jgi:GNAT superfamily N-acetyltransferase